MATALPVLTCFCKVKRCPVNTCGRCPRCGCECDGISVVLKTTRRRGRPKRTQVERAGTEAHGRGMQPRTRSKAPPSKTASSVDARVEPERTSISARNLQGLATEDSSLEWGGEEGAVSSSILRTSSIEVSTLLEEACRNTGVTSGPAEANAGATTPTPAQNATGPAAVAGTRVPNEDGMYIWSPLFTPTPAREGRTTPNIFNLMRYLDCEDALVEFMKKILPPKRNLQSAAFWVMSSSAAVESVQGPASDVALPGVSPTSTAEPQYVDECALPEAGQQDDHPQSVLSQTQPQLASHDVEQQEFLPVSAEASDPLSVSESTEDDQQINHCDSTAPTPSPDSRASSGLDDSNVQPQSPKSSAVSPALDQGTSDDDVPQRSQQQPPAGDQDEATRSRNTPHGNATERQQRSASLRLMRILVNRIVEIICGGEAAPAFLKFFREAVCQPELSMQSTLPKLMPLFMATKRGSIKRRCIRTHMCDVFSLSTLKTASEQIGGFTFGKNSYTSGRRDLDVLMDEGALEKVSWSQAKYDRRVVDNAIRYILSMENVVFLLWGTKAMKLDGKSHFLPSIQRRKPISVMFDQYLARGDASKVSRRTFYRIAGVLTHGEMQARKAVDYVTGFLVNDNFAMLERMIRELLPEESFDLLPKFAILKEWLKYGSGFDIDDDARSDISNCPHHQVVFGLTPQEEKDEASREVCCGPCFAMHTLLVDTKELLNESGVDSTTLGVWDDSYKKMKLFMGHRVRVRNQQRALQAAADAMKTACDTDQFSDEAIVILDCKMKLEPLYFREKTVDHYGKRGMSWHGAMVSYWTFDVKLGESVETKLYFDQICNGDNKQGKDAVVALVEAVLLSIRRDVPHLQRLTFQSDNASSYQNAYVGLMLPVIGAAHGFMVARYMHSDTQDGKCMLDAHYATASRKVKAWVRQVNDCITPLQVVRALTANGGLPNCVAELVEHARLKVVELYQPAKPMEKALSKLIDRANDIFYDFDVPLPPSEHFELSSCSPFRMRVFAYSNIGEGIVINVDPGNGTCSALKHPVSENGRVSERVQTSSVPNSDSTLIIESFTRDIQRRLSFGSENGGDVVDDTGTLPADPEDIRSFIEEENDFSDDEGGDAVDPDEDGADIQEDDDDVIQAQNITGVLTGVRIITKAQLRRRTRIIYHRGSLSSENTADSVMEKDVESYVKRSALELKTGGDFGHILDCAGLAANWLLLSLLEALHDAVSS